MSAQPQEEPSRSATTRVLFLDVDGVLHPFSANSFFHAPCMTQLRKIIGQTGAAIVLSSSWQSSSGSLAMVNAALHANGLPICVDKTLTKMGAAAADESGRGREINGWVSRNAAMCADGWVAIDDMDLRPHLPTGHFCRTRAESGLTERDADWAIKLLGGPVKGLPPLPPPPKNPGAFNTIVTRGEVQRDMMRAAMAQ